MRIVIDLQSAQTESRFRGIGRYSLALAKALVRNCGEHDVIIVLSGLFPHTIEPIRAEFSGLVAQENIRVWSAPGPVREAGNGNSWRRNTAELIREAFIASLSPDVVHIMSLFEGYIDDAVTSVGDFGEGVLVSVMLYDLIPLLNEKQYLTPSPDYAAYYRKTVAELGKTSLLLSISESSRREGLEYFGSGSGSIVNISTAADEHFKPLNITNEQAGSLFRKFGIDRPYLLYTGGVDHRKNLPRLIRAYSLLPGELQKTYQLVLVGKMPEGNVHNLRREVSSMGLRDDSIVFAGYASEEELVKLYNLCSLYVFPSWHEGFGLPALEAMACGAAVIGSNTSSLPEVIGNPKALFDPYEEESIAKKIEYVLTFEGAREELIAHGLTQANKFSWDISAKKAIEAFERFSANKSLDNDAKYDLDTLRKRLIDRIAFSIVVPDRVSEKDLVQTALSIFTSLGESGPSKLFVDVTEIVRNDNKTGIQRVVRNILNEWLSDPPKNLVIEPVYLTNKNGCWQYCCATSFKNKALGAVSSDDDYAVEPLPSDIFVGLDLSSSVLEAIRAGLFSGWRARGVGIHFIVYDILPIHRPEWWPQGGSELHAAWLQGISQVADNLVSISKSVSDDVKGWLGANGQNRLIPLKHSWFHLGADIENSAPSLGMPEDADDRLRRLRGRSTFLMVGTIEPRKGHRQALDAFEKLWDEGVDVNLVIVGKEGWLVDALVERLRGHEELNKKLFWLEGISDEYLEQIYSASSCLIAASEGEGFGLPLIEAAQHKIPMIVRDIPIFREVAGNHAFYFDSEEASGLAASVQEWLDLYAKNTHPVSDKMPWLTWKESAQQLLDIVIPSVYVGKTS